MGGKPRPERYKKCLCCGDVILPVNIRTDLHVNTLKEIGLCDNCVTGDVVTETLDELDDELSLTLDEQHDLNVRIEAHRIRIDILDNARDRAVVYFHTRKP